MHRDHRHTMTWMAVAAVMVGAVAALFPGVAAAVGTPAGTAITNQATVTYQDASANSFSAMSNTTTITVLPVYSVAITAPADQSVPSNTIAYYAYTLTNTGNATDTFNLSALSAPPGWGVVLYADDGAGGGVANDGIHQAGETTVIASSGALAADATYRFFMGVTIPAGTANGTTDTTTLTVIGTGDAGPGDDTADAVTTTAQAPSLTVAKEVRNVTTGGAFGAAANATPSQNLEYRVTATNGGPIAASSVILSDPINANTGFVVGTAVFNVGTSGLASGTAQYSNDAGATWAYVPASGGCAAPAGADYCVTNIRWTTTGSMASGGTSFNTLFQVRVK